MTKTTIKTIESNVTLIKKGDKVKKNGDMFVISPMGKQNSNNIYIEKDITRSDKINSALFGNTDATPMYSGKSTEVYVLVSITTGERYYPNPHSLTELAHKMMAVDGFKKVNEVEIIEKF
ncbi:hypothetical protein ACQKIY_25500 [Bacillus mycoides]|uniref:hypothetical protein n=1 Tax=Bacillus mycoides TaxID=1405 RepID=UPI003D030D68